MPGRHASDSSAGFYRDLAMMVVGILLVGAAVFILLYLLAGNGSDPVVTTSTTAGSELSTTTEEPVSTTTTEAQVSTTTTTSLQNTTSTVPVRPPSEVTVIVLNSIGVQGVAGRLTQNLAENGYQTLEASNYEPELDPSRIWYREGYSAEANELLDFVPGAQVEALPEEELEPGADVVIILGTGYEE